MSITKISRSLLNTGVSDSSDATAITIDSSENVGIGETSPLGKIHAKVSDTSASASAQGNLLVLEDTENGLSILSSTSGAGYINFGDSGDNNIGMIIYDHSANAMNFWVNAAQRMLIDSNGKVIINARSDALNLQVKAEDDDSYFGVYDDANNSANIEIRNSAGNQTFYVLGHNGNYFFNGSSVSDRDLKENIEAISESSLAKVKLLEPKTFNFKADDNFGTNKKTGFIAQEVAAIFGTTDGVATGTDGQKDMGIDPTGLIAHLTKAIQEQQTIIEDLKARIETLEG